MTTAADDETVVDIMPDSVLLAMLKVVGGEVARVDGDSVRGVFTPAGTLVQLGDHFVESETPEFECRTSDVPHIDRESTVVLREVRYRAAEIMPDGSGVTKLRLVEI